MVDPERLHRVLRRVTEDLALLAEYANARADRVRDDPAQLGHVKYLFITAIEGCIDAAQHLCASEGWGPPETNADAVRLLGRHGVVRSDIADRIAAAVGFRNVLVHGYAGIDDHRVMENLGRLDDLHAYVDDLTRLIS